MKFSFLIYSYNFILPFAKTIYTIFSFFFTILIVYFKFYIAIKKFIDKNPFSFSIFIKTTFFMKISRKIIVMTVKITINTIFNFFIFSSIIFFIFSLKSFFFFFIIKNIESFVIFKNFYKFINFFSSIIHITYIHCQHPLK